MSGFLLYFITGLGTIKCNQTPASPPGGQQGGGLILFPVSEFFFFFLINLFIYFWLCWVFFCVPGLPLVAASGGHSSSRCADLSLSRPLPLRSTGSRRAGSAIVAHGPSCSAACGILPDQGSNPCLLHWQADSQPLRHQGSPSVRVLLLFIAEWNSVSWMNHNLLIHFS